MWTSIVLMAMVVDGGLYRGFEDRRFKRMLDELTNHFNICGYGCVGSTIAEEFGAMRRGQGHMEFDPSDTLARPAARTGVRA